MRVLVTGFEPFGGELINSGYEAVKLLPDSIEKIDIIRGLLPTTFGGAVLELKSLIEENNPDVVLCIGQAGNRASITIEKVAINTMDARIPDNDDYRPTDIPVDSAGAAAFFTNLPIRDIIEDVRAIGIPCEVSYTAGTFVCNTVFYSLMSLIESKYPLMLGGFVHVPLSPGQTANKERSIASMNTEDIACAINQIIKTSGRLKKRD